MKTLTPKQMNDTEEFMYSVDNLRSIDVFEALDASENLASELSKLMTRRKKGVVLTKKAQRQLSIAKKQLKAAHDALFYAEDALCEFNDELTEMVYTRSDDY